MIQTREITEKKAALTVAELMAAAARTAPKGCGIDNLEILLITDAEKDRLAAKMKQIGQEAGIGFFIRDGYGIDASSVVVLLGTRLQPIQCPNCGFCGYENCGDNAQNNGVCAFNSGDLGIAVGSAVSVAADHRCDNRVLFSAGKAALELGYFSPDVKIAYGIPLSVSGKSPFFDRIEVCEA